MYDPQPAPTHPERWHQDRYQQLSMFKLFGDDFNYVRYAPMWPERSAPRSGQMTILFLLMPRYTQYRLLTGKLRRPSDVIGRDTQHVSPVRDSANYELYGRSSLNRLSWFLELRFDVIDADPYYHTVGSCTTKHITELALRPVYLLLHFGMDHLDLHWCTSPPLHSRE